MNCFLTTNLEIQKFNGSHLPEMIMSDFFQCFQSPPPPWTEGKDLLFQWKWMNASFEGHGWILVKKKKKWFLIHSFENRFQKKIVSLSFSSMQKFVHILRVWNKNDPNHFNSLYLYPLLIWLQVDTLWTPIEATQMKMACYTRNTLQKDKKDSEHYRISVGIKIFWVFFVTCFCLKKVFFLK